MKLRLLNTLFFIILTLTVTAQPPEMIHLGSVAKTGYGLLESYGPFNIGFNFTFFGNVYNQFYVTSSGLVLFGTGSTDGSEDPIPTAGTPNNFIAAFWDQLVIDGTGKILYTTIGDAPDRKLVIQFKNMGFYTGPVFMGTFSTILYETTNKIQVQYRLIVDNNSTRAHGTSATIGIENADGTVGFQHSYRTASVVTEQAISFTPTPPTSSDYAKNSNSVYDGVYLTTNTSLPEPGITNLITPAQNAVVGADNTFEWSAASNAAYYTLYISKNPDLSSPVIEENVGSSLTHYVSGLDVGETYYWGVFATNATGTTWCQIKTFTTAATPPLAAVPNTYYVEYLVEKEVTLQYTGGDASTKTAYVTTLPAQGKLYQMLSGGGKGDLITSASPKVLVTNSAHKLIYVADGSLGNGAGSFNFLFHDDSGDSPTAAITINVIKANQTITFPNLPVFTYGATDYDPTATASSGLTVSYSSNNTAVATIVSGKIHIVGAGNAVITATQAGNTFYNAASSVQKSLTVNKATLTVTADNKTRIYGDPNPALTISYSGFVNSETVTVLDVLPAASTTAGPATNAGTVPITVSGGSDNNYTYSYVSGTLTITKAPAAVTLGSLATTYNGLPQAASATTNPIGLTVNFTYDGSATIPVNAASYAVVATINDINYQGTNSGTLIIGKATITATADNKTKLYGEANPALTISYSGFVNSENASVLDATVPLAATTADATTNVSIVPITVSGGVDNNYTYNYVSGTLTINKATLTATADDKTRIYGDPNPPLTITYSGFVNSETTSVLDVLPVAVTTAAPATNTGIVAITVSGGSDNNYSFSYVNGALTINKATLTVTADDKTRIYGDPNPPLTITYSGFVNSETVTVLDVLPAASTTAGTATNAGTVPITVSGGSDNNYTYSYVSGTLTITKAPAAVTLGSLATTYNGLPQAASATTNPVGLTVDFTYDGSATIPVNAASYAIVATINDINYQGTNSGTLTIGKATLTATADNKTKLYGEANPALTISYSGFVNSENASVLDLTLPAASTTADATTNVGTVPVTVSGGVDNNYTYNYVTGTLTINKATLTATADDKTRVYGDANPALTITYSGFVNSETASVIDTEPLASTTAVTVTDAGTIPITVSGGIDNNYTFSYVSGTLTITKATATVILGNLSATYSGLPQSATATTTPAGLTVDFTYDGSATIPVNAASYAVVATINDINYLGNSSGTLVIGKANQTIAFNSLPNKTYGDGDFTLSAVSGSGFSVSFVSSNTAVATVAGNTVRIVGAGTTTITASQAGDANWNAAANVTRTLTVNKATQSISFSLSVDKLLVGDELTLVATSSSGLPVLFESNDNALATVTGNILKGVSKGTVQIRAYHAGGQNYLAAEMLASIEIYSTHKEILHLFTPNSDGFNDYWELPDLATWGKCDVRVFSRSGKLIFSDPDYNNLWDGMSNGYPVPEGAYYFVIKTEKAGVVKGTVNIVR
jgi:gliding motility-associated-like protein